MTSSFTHLHVHSNYSLCRGGNTIDSLCRRAAEFGMKSLALTDTNGLYGLKWFINTAKSYKLDPIIGVYLQTEKYDCIMLAKNIKGYHYLSGAVTRLHSSESDFEQYLSSYHDVIIITNNSYLLNYFTENNLNRDIFVELVSFQNCRSLIKYARENNFPVVATNSVYFLNPEDWETHQLLRAIDLNTSQSSLPEDQIVSKEAYLKSSKQMWDLFSHVSEAVENTQKIADQCRFNLDFKNFIFTSIRGEKGETAFELLEERVKYGIIWRYGNMTGAIKKRYDYEMEIIRQKNFAPYFLVVQDIVEQAPRTCGRGSAAASLVSYCLGITHVDPIKYDLFFDRFLNPGRTDPPDIDVDFPWDERDQILDYIFTKYGTECTAMISNHNSFKARSAVREIAKVYGMPENEISSVTKKLGFFWQPDNIWEITQSHPVYKNTFLDQPWPEIIALAEKIRGFPRHLSIHCGGVIIAPDGIERYVPTQPAKKILRSLQKDSLVDIPQVLYGENKINVIQWEKDQAEEMGTDKAGHSRQSFSGCYP